jgi:hypothetical protein
MTKRIFNLRKVAMVIACLAVTTVFASCEKEKEEKPTGGEDVEFTIYVNGTDSWTPFTGKTSVTFTNSDNDVLSIDDNGTTVEFTGKQVGNSTITAKLGEETLKALVRVRAIEGNGKKYITYNKPVTAYYIEYNGGMVEANKKYGSGNNGYVVEAYETMNYTEIKWNSSLPGWLTIYTEPSGLQYSHAYGNTEWYRHTGNGNGNQDTWGEDYRGFEYPLGAFAAYVSYYKGTTTFYKYGLDLATVAFDENLVMPNHTDVTEFYVRSEKVANILCDVYKNRFNGEDFTFWVDPTTGFTLKFERVWDGNIQESYEVSTLVVGKPDWDGKHLRPIAGDTFIDVD